MPKRVEIEEERRTEMIACRINKRLFQFVQARANAKGITRSAYVERCIQDAYDKLAVTPASDLKRRYGQPSEKALAEAAKKPAGAITMFDPRTGDPIPDKPRKASRLKGHWKAP